MFMISMLGAPLLRRSLSTDGLNLTRGPLVVLSYLMSWLTSQQSPQHRSGRLELG